MSQAEGTGRGSGRVVGRGGGEVGVQRSALEEKGGFSELRGGAHSTEETQGEGQVYAVSGGGPL